MVQTSKIRHYFIGDRVHVTAQQFWSILIGFAKWGTRGNRNLLTFGELAEQAGYADGRAGAVIGRQLQIISEFCIENNLPDLSSIVSRRDEIGQPSQAQQDALDYNWYLIGVPTTGMFRKIWENKN
jgi:hypothetical protein